MFVDCLRSQGRAFHSLGALKQKAHSARAVLGMGVCKVGCLLPLTLLQERSSLRQVGARPLRDLQVSSRILNSIRCSTFNWSMQFFQMLMNISPFLETQDGTTSSVLYNLELIEHARMNSIVKSIAIVERRNYQSLHVQRNSLIAWKRRRKL